MSSEPSPERGFYLYALTRPEDPGFTARPIDAKGVDGGAVMWMELGALGALVGELDLTAWTGAAGESNLQEIAWVAPRAVAHEEVVLAASQRAPVCPMRFGTIFSSLEAMIARTEPHTKDLLAYFDRIDGADEWTIKGFLDEAALKEALLEQTDEDAPAGKGSGGMSYLLKKRQERDIREQMDRWLLTESAAAFEQCAAHAIDAQTLVIRGNDRRDDGSVLVSKWALLIPDEDEAFEAFADTLDAVAMAWAGHGYSFELHGPHPPYHFRPEV